MGDLHTRSEVAAMLGVSERTLRRMLPKVPALSCHRIGRKVYFSDQDLEIIKRATRCPYTTASGAKSGMSGGRSGSGIRLSKSQSGPQDAARELMLKLSGRLKKPASAATCSKGRATKPAA